MKIRKLLALVTVFAMIATVMPAFGLTASAAISEGQGIVTSDDQPYAAASDDFITDGAFETDAWEDALTTGAYAGPGGGNPGVDAVIKMNTDKNMAAVGATAFKRVDGREGGYAISPAFEAFSPGTTIPRYTNDENGPTSIKHYIHNTSGSKKTYYASFWAKAVGDDASLSYYIGPVGADDILPSSKKVNLSSEWTHIDAVADVKGGDYLIINVFDMDANAVALDDFEACEVSQTGESKKFAAALAKWETTFPYKNGDIVRGDMTLPAKVADARVTYVCSNPDILDVNTGKVTMVKDDTPIELSVTITYSTMSTTLKYNLTVEGLQAGIKSAVQADGYVPKFINPKDSKVELPSTVPGYAGSTVEWSSSNPAVLDGDGSYNPGEGVDAVTLTAHVTYNDIEVEQDVTVYTGQGLTTTLIPNGAFEVHDGTSIPGWTVGSLAPMTTDSFDYMLESNGNHYILSKLHHDAYGDGSIRMYYDLEPGKMYHLSFKMWYNGDGSCEESYTAAVLVANHDGMVEDSGGGNFAPVATYGGFELPRGSYKGELTYSDHWRTIDCGILSPDKTYNTLLVTSRWLNKQEAGHNDGRWAFDDFILEEVDIPFYADVTINYVDENGNTLKKSKTVKDQNGNFEYKVSDAEKEDITTGTGNRKKTYRYLPSSVDHVLVKENEPNVINLVFKELVQADVTVNVLDKESGKKLKDTVVDKTNGFVGFEYTADSSTLQLNMTTDGVTYALDEDTEYTITVSENKNDNVINLYYEPVRGNIITNGDFSNGYTGWTNRKGTALSGGTIAIDPEFGTNALTINTGGRDSDTAIGTAWTGLQVGMEYVFSFDVGGSKPESGNYQYNKVSDAFNNNAGIREVAGNELIQFGEIMTNGTWNHMEMKFTASTDTLYIQSSWTNGIKFANFVLRPVGKVEYGSVQVKFVDKEGNQIKQPQIIEGLLANSTYTVPETMTADFEQDGFVYKFDETSVKSAKVVANSTVDITLTFEKLSVADVTVSFKDASGNTLKADEPVSGEIGKAFEITAALKATISKDGKMYVYTGSDPAELTVNADPDQNKITLYFAETSNLITNGDFETQLDGVNIPDWTVGGGSDGKAGVAQMTTSSFTVETDDDENHYLRSVGPGATLAGASSLKRFVDLTPGKQYKFSFRIKRLGGDVLAESWIEAPLVGDDGNEIREGTFSHDDIVGFRSNYGSLIPERDGTDMFLIGPDNGWVTVERTLTPDDTHKTLLIGAKWLDNNWAFDDFTLVEMGDKTTGSVRIKFVDENGTELKAPVTVDELTAGNSYSVSAEHKADITGEDGIVYRLVASKSTLSVNVVEGSTVEATLVFAPAPSTVTIADNKATVKANAAVNGEAVVAQYDADGNLVKAELKTVELEAGASTDIDITFAEGTTDVKVFVIDSLSTLAPLTNAAEGKAPGAPLESSVGQNADAFHPIDAQTGKVRYTFDFVDNSEKDSGVVLGNSGKVNSSSGNYFEGSIVILFANGELHTRDNVSKNKVTTYNVGERVSISIDADIEANTYDLTVNGNVVATGVHFREPATSIDTLALVENNGSSVPFYVYDFKAEPIE